MIDETLTISKLSDDELYFFAATGFDEAKTKFMNDLSSDEIQKHQQHDQQSHGNWATKNFNEEKQGEEAQNIYFEKYGIKTDGSKDPVGISRDEIRSLDDYTADGFLKINKYLRFEGTSPFEEGSYYDSVSRGINENRVADLDKLIEESPDLFGDKNLYRVFSNVVFQNLQKGDVLTDKGFLSTTRVDITDSKNADSLENLKLTSGSNNTTGIILPSSSGKGKGLAVDYMKNAVSDLFTNTGSANREKEVLLPRSTPLKFIGYKTDVGSEEQVAIFQRLDNE
jgi:hypothetical protein